MLVVVRLIFGCWGGLIVLLGVRLWRQSVTPDSAGMTVRNPWRTTRLDWDEVAEMGLVKLTTNPILVIRKNDGTGVIGRAILGGKPHSRRMNAAEAALVELDGARASGSSSS